MATTQPRQAQILNLVSALAAKAPLASPNFSGTPLISGAAIATQAYVNTVMAGVVNRVRVRVATTGNVNLSTGLANGQTVDGVTLATGNLVLVRSQTDPAENGIYTVPASGAASRSSQFDTFDEHPGAVVGVQEGTTKGDTLWFCTTNEGGTLGTDAIVFTQLVIAGELLAANNLSDVANSASARSNLGVGAEDTPEFAGIELGHASDTTITRASAGNVAVEGNLIYRAGGTDVPIADGGTGASTAAGAFDNLKQPATESATGVVELATTSEAVAGSDTSRAITAAGLKAHFDARPVIRETPTPAVDGSTTTFSIANSPLSGSEQVFLNGILQEPGGEDYTISGTTITFVTAPDAADRLRVSYFKA